MTNGPRRTTVFVIRHSSFVIRHSVVVIPSSFVIRHSSFGPDGPAHLRVAGLLPLLLAPLVVADVRVAQGRQFTGGLLGGASGETAAVDHNVGVLVRQHLGGQRADAAGRYVGCGR